MRYAFMEWREHPERSVLSIQQEFYLSDKETWRVVHDILPIWREDARREELRKLAESDHAGYVPPTMGAPGLGKKA
jgi:hypothetical protein